uniref:Uncharacterized protein n=1 Tax=Anguilla anguilla TaxID=7936 RepID=A0A0E9RVW1_ANGAN
MVMKARKPVSVLACWLLVLLVHLVLLSFSVHLLDP